MMAPAWPIRFPGGAVVPAMNAATGLFIFSLMNLAARSSAPPPISPIMMTPCGVGIGLEKLEHIDEVHPADGIAADADARRLPDAERRQLPNRFVRERARARHDADVPCLVNVTGHDADFARHRA